VKTEQHDTIAALSTPEGSGGIAVIRISGSRALEAADRIFEGSDSLVHAASHHVVFGKIVGNGEVGERRDLLDEVLVTVFKAPKSYTGEDVVEISCHGGRYVSHRILDMVVQNGARTAQPGEFTLRAYLNGRLDLTQAEAVADIISAKTEESLKVAAHQLSGQLSEKIKSIREMMLDMCAMLELELDFAEEDVKFADRDETAARINSAITEIEAYLSTYRRARVLKEGAKLVIAGKPNVGKSSLLNALLKQERAIVTEVAGTTRDILEEQIDIRGVYFRIVDTAGIHMTDDRIEKIGVQRSLTQIQQADIVLFLFDGSQPVDARDRMLIDQVMRDQKKAPICAVINKSDLQQEINEDEIESLLQDERPLHLSAKELSGFPELEEKLVRLVMGEPKSGTDQVLVTNIRQKAALEDGLRHLRAGMGAIEAGLSSEFVAFELREASHCMGEIIGEISTEDVLSNIFSKFCIGK
jgi:tRNA modification GTPase